MKKEELNVWLEIAKILIAAGLVGLSYALGITTDLSLLTVLLAYILGGYTDLSLVIKELGNKQAKSPK